MTDSHRSPATGTDLCGCASASPRRHRSPATSFPVSVFTFNPPQSPAVSPLRLHQALKLSDDLHLNEIECLELLISANQEWGLLG
nr:nuclear pore complex protein NUP205 isoform X1 [Ipomoea batatas]